MRYWIPALVFAFLIFFISAQERPPGRDLAPDYIAHFLEYGVFAMTLLWGVTRGLNESITLKRTTVSFFISFVYAATDEFHQRFVPNRTASWSDVAADAIGAAVFLSIALICARIRRKGPLTD